MGLAALVLADARFPGGGHVHSGGLEEAVARELVRDLSTLASFLHGRLRTAGLVAATFAAAATRLATAGAGSGPGDAWDAQAPSSDAWDAQASRGTSAGPVRPDAWDAQASLSGAWASQASTATAGAGAGGGWAALDDELDARTPSAAQREASRAQGRGALRAARAAWPSPVIDALVAVHPRPHHPLLVGAVCGTAGDSPEEAARCAAYLAISGPASAAVRLLGLDPFAVNAVLVRLGPVLDTTVAEATGGAPTSDAPIRGLPTRGAPTTSAATDSAAADGDATDGPQSGSDHPTDPAAFAHLPAPGAPVLDLLAQAHAHPRQGRMRLFAS